VYSYFGGLLLKFHRGLLYVVLARSFHINPHVRFQATPLLARANGSFQAFLKETILGTMKYPSKSYDAGANYRGRSTTNHQQAYWLVPPHPTNDFNILGVLDLNQQILISFKANVK
jgi:hypothetical protein